MGNDGERPPEQRFGARMRRERELMGLTQAQFADELAAAGWVVHPSAVAKVEAGSRALRLNEAAAVCEVIGIGLREMLQDENADWHEALSLLKSARVAVSDAHVAMARAVDECERLGGNPLEISKIPAEIRHEVLMTLARINTIALEMAGVELPEG